MRLELVARRAPRHRSSASTDLSCSLARRRRAHRAWSASMSEGGWEPSDSSGSEGGTPHARDAATSEKQAEPPARSSTEGGGRERSRSRSRSRSTSEEIGCSHRVRRVLFREHSQPLPTPPPMLGSEWWQKPVLTGTEHMRMALPDHPIRPLRHEALLCGLFTESWAFEALGMKVSTTLACDSKPASQRWVAKHRSQALGHFFHDISDATAARGRCAFHSKECQITTTPNLVTIGLPCQPFSSARDHSKCKPQDHKLFDVGFREFPAYLRARGPGGFVAEEVLGFDRTNRDTGVPYMREWCELCAELGYTVRAHRLSAGAFSEGVRERYYLVGVSEGLGGAKGAAFISNAIEDVLKYRALTSPAPLWDVLPKDPATMQARAQIKAELESTERSRTNAVGGAYAQWKKHTVEELDRLNLPPDYSGWTARPEYAGVGVPCLPRVHALLNVAWGKRLVVARKAGEATDVPSLAKGYFADLSQSVRRGPYGGQLSTLTTSSAQYSFEGDCLLSAEDSLSSLGFPAALRRSHSMTAADLRSLTGEGFSLPCIATVVMCFYLNPHGPWWGAKQQQQQRV